MVCEQCRVCMNEIPGRSYSYSDHAGVEATYSLRRNITGRTYQDGLFKCLYQELYIGTHSSILCNLVLKFLGFTGMFLFIEP